MSKKSVCKEGGMALSLWEELISGPKNPKNPMKKKPMNILSLISLVMISIRDSF